MRCAAHADFTSALYLGLWHPSSALVPWARLSAGAPASLVEPEGAARVAQQVAALLGCEHGTAATSTLHIGWDLFTILSRPARCTIFIDSSAYPILIWGAERAAARGTPVRTFRHHDPESLERELASSRGRPIVLTDGWCTGCGRAAPLAEYLAAVRPAGGLLVVDDTQALGILGSSPSPGSPLGSGGGGTLPWLGLAGAAEAIVVASLAKGLGAPLAVLAGPTALVRQIEANGEARDHCSPPAVPVVLAAAHALAVNARRGDLLRARLTKLVGLFRERTAVLRVERAGGIFPVQSVWSRRIPTSVLHEGLARQRINAVLHAPRGEHTPRVGFLITTRHDEADVVRAADALARSLSMAPSSRREVTHV